MKERIKLRTKKFQKITARSGFYNYTLHEEPEINLSKNGGAYLRDFQLNYPYLSLTPLYSFWENAKGVSFKWGYIDDRSKRIVAARTWIMTPEFVLRASLDHGTGLASQLGIVLKDDEALFEILTGGGQLNVYFLLNTTRDQGDLYVKLTEGFTSRLEIDLETFLNYTLDAYGLMTWVPEVMEKRSEWVDYVGMDFSTDFFTAFPSETHPMASQEKCRKVDHYPLNLSEYGIELRQKFAMLYNELISKSPELSLGMFDVSPRVVLTMPFTWNHIYKTVGFKLEDDFIQYVIMVNGFKMDWQFISVNYKEDDDADQYFDAIGCRLDFPIIEKILGGDHFLESDWRTYVHERTVVTSPFEEERQYQAQFRPLMWSEYNDVFFRIREDGTLELVWPDEGKFIPLTVGFRGFMDAFFESRGVQYFVQYLTPENHFIVPNPPVPEQIQFLFPNADMTKFRKSPKRDAD